MSGAEALDHVGVAAQDLTTAAAQFERLGFHLTPLARHAGGRTGNRCAMLRSGYIELLAMVDPVAGSATLSRFLARYTGVHIIALAVADPAAELARLQRAGIGCSEVIAEARKLDDSDPAGPDAHFTRLAPQDQPEGRFVLIRHDTPELLWQERFLHHANHAAALTEAVLAVADPAETAARLSRLAGRPVVPDRLGGFALDLAHGAVRILPAETVALLHPGITLPALPCIVGVAVRTSDGNAAVARLLAEHAIPHHATDNALLVEAGGVAVRFVT